MRLRSNPRTFGCDCNAGIVLAVGPGGQVIFSGTAIPYTSNKLTVAKEIVLEPTPG